MYERFSDRARKVFQLANQEAQRFNHEGIAPEHVLIGLIKEGAGVAANVLRNLSVDLGRVRSEVERLVKPGPDMMTMGRLPQTPGTGTLVDNALDAAKGLNHNYVGTEHLLLGMLADPGSVPTKVLNSLGVTTQEVKSGVLEVLKSDHKDAPAGEQLNEARTFATWAVQVLAAPAKVDVDLGRRMELVGLSLEARKWLLGKGFKPEEWPLMRKMLGFLFGD
jgi:ATP-dependent Clp protease ATP-binding subunit ClpC